MISIKNLYKTFYVPHEVKALVDVSNEIKTGEVVVVCVGKAEENSTIQHAMAMGAHRALHVKTDNPFPGSRLTARALQAVIEQDGLPDMIFTGKGSVDTEGFQTQYRLAGFLGMPVVNDVSDLNLDKDKVVVQSEIGEGRKQVIEMSLPCVIGAAKGLNEPRYPKFPDIMKARKKEIKTVDLAGLGIDASRGGVTMEKLDIVPERSEARMLEGTVDDQVTSLVRILKEDEKVI